MRVLTRQLPQVPDRWWRDETGTDQVVLDQLGQPLGVLDIGLASWSCPRGPDILIPDSWSVRGEDVVVPGASSYPESFRRDAVELVLSSPDRSLRQIALELGVSHETLRGWVRTARKQADPEQVAAAERAGETRMLRKRLAELEKENEILRKAAAYFAREMDR